MTQQEAIDFASSGKWKNLTYREQTELQFKETLLCMPFEIFHEAVEKTLKRPVWTHEFANLSRLKEELATLDATGKKRETPLKDALELLEEKNTIVVVTK